VAVITGQTVARPDIQSYTSAVKVSNAKTKIDRTTVTIPFLCNDDLHTAKVTYTLIYNTYIYSKKQGKAYIKKHKTPWKQNKTTFSYVLTKKALRATSRANTTSALLIQGVKTSTGIAVTPGKEYVYNSLDTAGYLVTWKVLWNVHNNTTGVDTIVTCTAPLENGPRVTTQGTQYL